MPQGVEHTIIRQEAVSPEVPAKPLMPQGVEHVQAIETALETGEPAKPLMPQGVEHLLQRHGAGQTDLLPNH